MTRNTARADDMSIWFGYSEETMSSRTSIRFHPEPTFEIFLFSEFPMPV